MYYYLCYNSNGEFIGFSQSEYPNFSKGFKAVPLAEYNTKRKEYGMEEVIPEVPTPEPQTDDVYAELAKAIREGVNSI